MSKRVFSVSICGTFIFQPIFIKLFPLMFLIKMLFIWYTNIFFMALPRYKGVKMGPMPTILIFFLDSL